MKVLDIVSPDQWETIKKYCPENPYIILAIGWHETQFGRLGAGRQGYYLGYGYYSAGNGDERYKGLIPQITGAYGMLKKSLRGWPVILPDTIADFGYNFWRPGSYDSNGKYNNTGRQWGASVWKYYQKIIDALPKQKEEEKKVDRELTAVELEAIELVKARREMSGRTDGTFDPFANPTRLEFAFFANQLHRSKHQVKEDCKKYIVKVVAGSHIGSGIIISGKHIITNMHVIIGALNPEGSMIDFSKLVVTDYKGTVIPIVNVPWGDGGNDSAILTSSRTDLEHVDIAVVADSGQPVFAIGYPANYANSVTAGIVSGIYDIKVYDNLPPIKYVLTDASINPGNSGGGLFDAYQKLVGMNSFKILTVGSQNVPVTNMGFALHMTEISKSYAKALEIEKSNLDYLPDFRAEKVKLNRFIKDTNFIDL